MSTHDEPPGEPLIDATRPLGVQAKRTVVPPEAAASSTASLDPLAASRSDPAAALADMTMPVKMMRSGAPPVVQVVAPKPVQPAVQAASAPSAAETSKGDWGAGKPLSGRYVMIDKLGEGGMGTVYLAEDLLLRRKVAVKTLWEDELYEEADIERFRKEVAVAHSVSHPNVARTYDLGEAGGVHYITMEYLRGTTLMGRIKESGKLPSKEVREIAVPLCRGLYAAHKAGVVHRDLKPANVMLIPGERKVSVMDFGIAAMVADKRDGSTQATRRADLRQIKSWDVTSAGLGTPVYMAPEQWDQTTGDARTDIYALGVILYVALTGQAPFHADSAEEIGNLHRTAPVPDVAKIVPDVDKDLAALIRHCLAKKPDDRPQSMHEILERLERPDRLRQFATQLAMGTLGAAAALFLVGFALYQLVASALIQEVRPSLRRLATVAAMQLTASDLDQIRVAADMRSPAYRNVASIVARIKEENPDVMAFYVMRPGARQGDYTYVFDVESADNDANKNGLIEPSEEGNPPGRAYDGRAYPMMAAALATGRPQADNNFAPDAGNPMNVVLSGYAPVPLGKKDAGYFVGVDASSEPLQKLRWALLLALSVAQLAIMATLGVLLSPSRRFAKSLESATTAV
ncbi:MAG: serine/threonine protein kinase [Myxococcales bacterium]|nr:serine/threonine protein kinase [Myxococcales bacterium]